MFGGWGVGQRAASWCNVFKYTTPHTHIYAHIMPTHSSTHPKNTHQVFNMVNARMVNGELIVFSGLHKSPVFLAMFVLICIGQVCLLPPRTAAYKTNCWCMPHFHIPPTAAYR